MNRIVNHEVSGISGHESAEEQPSIVSESNHEDHQKQGRDGQRHQGRHDQTVLIPGELMMDTMDLVLNLTGRFRFSIEMEYIAVYEVFHEREQEHPSREKPKIPAETDVGSVNGVSDRGNSDGIIHHNRNGKMRTRQPVQNRIGKYNSASFVIYLEVLHGRLIEGTNLQRVWIIFYDFRYIRSTCTPVLPG